MNSKNKLVYVNPNYRSLGKVITFKKRIKTAIQFPLVSHVSDETVLEDAQHLVSLYDQQFKHAFWMGVWPKLVEEYAKQESDYSQLLQGDIEDQKRYYWFRLMDGIVFKMNERFPNQPFDREFIVDGSYKYAKSLIDGVDDIDDDFHGEQDVFVRSFIAHLRHNITDYEDFQSEEYCDPLTSSMPLDLRRGVERSVWRKRYSAYCFAVLENKFVLPGRKIQLVKVWLDGNERYFGKNKFNQFWLLPEKYHSELESGKYKPIIAYFNQNFYPEEHT